MSSQHKSFWMSPKGFAAIGLIGATSYFLLMEHRQHLFQWLPFLILLLCPLMHLFMHGGHGGHGGHENGEETNGDEALKEAYRRGFEEGKGNSSPDKHQHHH